MKSITVRPLLLVVLPLMASLPGLAGTILLVSNTSLTNSGSGTTYDIAPDSVWAGPLSVNGVQSSWVSDVSTTNDNTPVGSTTTFTDTFTLTGNISQYIGSITVLADDSASVSLNGHILYALNPNQGTYCANAPIGCLTSTELTLSLPTADFVAGANQLSFGVRQGVADTAYGLDFAGAVSNAPEPAGLGFLGFALVLASLGLRRLLDRLRNN